VKKEGVVAKAILVVVIVVVVVVVMGADITSVVF